MIRLIGLSFCIVLNARFGYFSLYREIHILKDSYSSDYTIKTLSGCCMTVEKCATECQTLSSCNAFYFNDNNDECHLHYMVIDVPSMVVMEIGWRYFCRFEEYIEYIETTSYEQVNLLSRCIDVTKKFALIFRVKGCEHAIIGLTPNDTSNSYRKYEIIIGEWGNARSSIYNEYYGISMAEFYGSVLECSTYKTFWVSWENGNITVGTGSQIGNNTFLIWNDPSPINVALAYISCSDKTINWIFEL